MSNGGDTGARELGLVIIGLGCLLTIVTSTFGAVWVFHGLGWAFVSGLFWSGLLLVIAANMIDKS